MSLTKIVDSWVICPDFAAALVGPSHTVTLTAVVILAQPVPQESITSSGERPAKMWTSELNAIVEVRLSVVPPPPPPLASARLLVGVSRVTLSGPSCSCRCRRRARSGSPGPGCSRSGGRSGSRGPAGDERVGDAPVTVFVSSVSFVPSEETWPNRPVARENECASNRVTLSEWARCRRPPNPVMVSAKPPSVIELDRDRFAVASEPCLHPERRPDPDPSAWPLVVEDRCCVGTPAESETCGSADQPPRSPRSR